MCVIFLAETKRPTDEMVERAYDSNPSGAGIAWRENNLVRWDKGLDATQMKEYFRTLPLPMVGHFRIPTCGGARPSLCHPFPIEKGAPLDLSGQTRGYVLFHNGHWTRWKDTMMEAVVRHNLHAPAGKWSDSRAMAWSAAHFGLFTLDFIDEKALAFGPKDIEIFGKGWEKAGDAEHEIWVSNKHWEHTSRATTYYGPGGQGANFYSGGTLCRFGVCKEKKFSTYDYCFEHLTNDKKYREDQAAREAKGKSGGTSDATTFRPGPAGAGDGDRAQSQTAEEAAKAVGTAGDGGKEAREAWEARATRPLTPNDHPGIVKWARSFNPKRGHGTPNPINGHKPDIVMP